MTTKGKNYNSIVFLTTLSVYLGLVLAGGAGVPQVMAQAALARSFDVNIEAEIKDDLDKKPDDDAIELSGPAGGYFDELEDFIADLLKLHQIEKFNLDYDSFQVKQSEVVQCNLEAVRRAAAISNTKKVSSNWLTPAIADAIHRFENYAFLGDCLPNDKLGKNKGVNFELETSCDKSAFKFAISITKDSPQKAKQLLERFNQAYSIYKLDEEKIIIRKIYENTTFSSENNQVFIVTRLPRGSIDSLLATTKNPN